MLAGLNELRLTIIADPVQGAATVMKGLPLSKVYYLLERGPVALLTTARKAAPRSWRCPGI